MIDISHKITVKIPLMVDFRFCSIILLLYFEQVATFHHDPVLDDLNLPSFRLRNQFHQVLFVVGDALLILIAFSRSNILKSSKLMTFIGIKLSTVDLHNLLRLALKIIEQGTWLV